MRAYIDSDVVIASLLSSNGAAYFLLNQSKVIPVVSSLSIKELRNVVERLEIPRTKLDSLIHPKFEILKNAKSREECRKEYGRFVTDPNDSHIVAGAHLAQVQFLITYNLKHFKRDSIRDELDVLILTPALFLQHLRSN